MVPPGMPPPGSGRKTQICAYWKEGRCTRGSLCAFAHGDHELESEARKRFLASQPSVLKPPLVPVPPRAVSGRDRAGQRTSIGSRLKSSSPSRRGGTKPVHFTKRDSIGVEERAACVVLEYKPEAEADVEMKDDATKDVEMKNGDAAAATEEKQTAEEKAPTEETASDAKGAEEKAEEKVDGPVEAKPEKEQQENATTIVDDDDVAEVVDVDMKEKNKEVHVDVDKDDREKKLEKEKEELEKKRKEEEQAKLDEANKYPEPASFLLSEEGLDHLMITYDLGCKLLTDMGWSFGKGVGRDLQGKLEPIAQHVLSLASLRFGNRDRRPHGYRAPRRFLDSDAGSDEDPDRRPDRRRGRRGRSDSSGGSTRSSRKSSEASSSDKSRSRSHRRRKRRRRTTKVESSGSGSASSRSSSSSSSSGSSRSGRRRKRRTRRRSRDKGKKEGGGAGGFSSTAAGSTPGQAAGGSQSAKDAAAGAAVLASQGGAAKEDPDIAQAKKNVLAKLTTMKNVEPKEERAKQFRFLLREWHPDKNPERLDMATAVFQFLQKGKSLLNLK